MDNGFQICQVCKKGFAVEEQGRGLYEVLGVSPPSFCPTCRLIRRFATRNERSLYRRACGLCNKNILSIYNPEKNLFVVCPTCWYSDAWNPFDYGKDYDGTRSFFSQYHELKSHIPLAALYQSNFSNSEYANFGLDFKNCYLVFGGFRNEDVYYSNQIHDVYDSLDVSFCDYLEQSYECWKCSKGYRLMYSSYCDDCSECWFCIDCRNTKNCIACCGLRNKQYCIMNEQYPKQEFEQKIKEFSLHSFKKLQEFSEKAARSLLSKPRKFARLKSTIACTGDDIVNSRDGRSSFFLHNADNVTNVFFGIDIKDSSDVSYMGTGGAELLYESMSSYGGYRQVTCTRCQYSRDAYYSEECHGCENVFGCIGLRNKNYCILNKEYASEEWTACVHKIQQDMCGKPYTDAQGRKYVFGDFWPIELSAFDYNETKAQEYFPLSKDEAEMLGYPYGERKQSQYAVSVAASDLPDLTSEAPADITTRVVGCAYGGSCNDSCTYAFRLTAHEISWYEKLGLPLPRTCPNCRYAHRRQMGCVPLLYDRSCMCAGTTSASGIYQNMFSHIHRTAACANAFKTVYAPNRKELVYCDNCYQSEIQ